MRLGKHCNATYLCACVYMHICIRIGIMSVNRRLFVGGEVMGFEFRSEMKNVFDFLDCSRESDGFYIIIQIERLLWPLGLSISRT